MREILFRGKTFKGKWVFGSLYHIRDIYKIHQSFSDYEYNNLGYISQSYDVVPETVGQYTGLKDKNGNKIYEGDILKVQELGNENEYFNAKVVFQKGCFGIEYGFHFESYPEAEEVSVAEIIGNIHDNPELLQ